MLFQNLKVQLNLREKNDDEVNALLIGNPHFDFFNTRPRCF